MSRKTKPLPCPRCKNEELSVGDCGYTTFNVCWVRCPLCHLHLEKNGDNAVVSWNRWVSNPIKSLKQHIFEFAANERRRISQDDKITMQEFVAESIYNSFKNSEETQIFKTE